MKIRPIRTGSIALLAITALILGGACAEETAPTTTAVSPDTPTLDEILSGVGANVAAMSSTKFSMVDETETGSLFFGTTFKSMEAEVKTPNDFTMTVDVVSPSFGFVEVGIVKVGDQAFIQLSEDAPWSPLAPEQVPFNFEGLGVVFADLPATIQDAVLIGRETVQGAPTFRVEGTVESDSLSSLITSADPGHTVTLIMWVDEASLGLRQVRIAGQIYDDDAPETTRLLTLEDVNEPVEIELPDSIPSP